jgi:hypothetical protein
MDPAQTHTSIAYLIDNTSPADNTNSPSIQSQTTVSQPSPPTPIPISTGATKESGPSRSSQEVGSEQVASGEQSVEAPAEGEKKKETVRHKKETPDIHPEAAKAGLQVAPSASQFPTIYDVKVPVYKDEQIVENLHKNFWTGARWLAEMCKYILWQAHIKLRKVGDKIVRERIPERS